MSFELETLRVEVLELFAEAQFDHRQAIRSHALSAGWSNISRARTRFVVPVPPPKRPDHKYLLRKRWDTELRARRVPSVWAMKERAASYARACAAEVAARFA